jgi:hypothetical protein
VIVVASITFTAASSRALSDAETLDCLHVDGALLA